MSNDWRRKVVEVPSFNSCGYYAAIVRQDWRKCGHVGEFMWCKGCPEIERAEEAAKYEEEVNANQSGS